MNISGEARESLHGQRAPTHQGKKQKLKEDAVLNLTEWQVCKGCDIQDL